MAAALPQPVPLNPSLNPFPSHFFSQFDRLWDDYTNAIGQQDDFYVRRNMCTTIRLMRHCVEKVVEQGRAPLSFQRDVPTPTKESEGSAAGASTSRKRKREEQRPTTATTSQKISRSTMTPDQPPSTSDQASPNSFRFKDVVAMLSDVNATITRPARTAIVYHRVDDDHRELSCTGTPLWFAAMAVWSVGEVDGRGRPIAR